MTHHDPIAALGHIFQGRKVVALTGAGCSTESGIPDYRGPKTRNKARNPIQFQEFLKQPQRRQRYWSRSIIGWPRFSSAQPGPAHIALSNMETSGHLHGIITQNVDRLHSQAGSKRVVELHGALAEVSCLTCKNITDRHLLQSRLTALNPNWLTHQAEIAPDGDAELKEGKEETFKVADCALCQGILKPKVVFFGENVPRPVYDDACQLMEEAEALLVLGSSLAVYSGYRFVREAAQRNLPVGMINLGAPQRGLDLVDVFVESPVGQALPALAQWFQAHNSKKRTAHVMDQADGVGDQHCAGQHRP